MVQLSQVIDGNQDDVLSGHLPVQDPLQMGHAKHGDKGKEWIAERYWHRKENRKWVFCTEKNVLFRPPDVKKKRHVKVRNSVNPYIDREYFMERQKSRKYERGYRDKTFAM